MSEWSQFTQLVGFPSAALAAMMLSLVLLAKWADRRLFDDDKGTVPKYLRESKEFNNSLVKELKDHNAAQRQMCNVAHESLAHIEQTATQQAHSHIALLDTAIALMRNTDVLQNGEKRRVEEKLIAAKSALEQK